MITSAVRLPYRCPDCGVPVEDEGHCLRCYDALVDRAAKSGWSQRQRQLATRRRDAEILEACRQGAHPQDLARRYGIALCTVQRVMSEARRRERRTRAA